MKWIHREPVKGAKNEELRLGVAIVRFLRDASPRIGLEDAASAPRPMTACLPCADTACHSVSTGNAFGRLHRLVNSSPAHLQPGRGADKNCDHRRAQQRPQFRV
jgi:hypothetical protein